jgi:hypothetical protein
MIPVKVAVHQIPNGLVCDFPFDLRQQGGRRRRLRVSIHNEDVAIQYKDCGVAVGQGLRLGQCGKNSVCDLLDGKESRVRSLRLSSHPAGTKECLFKDRRSSEHASKAVSKKVTTVVMVVMMVMVAHGTSRISFSILYADRERFKGASRSFNE